MPFIVNGATRLLYGLCFIYISIKWLVLINFFIKKKIEKNIRLHVYPTLSKTNISVFRFTYTITIAMIVLHFFPIFLGFMKDMPPFCNSPAFVITYHSLVFIGDPFASTAMTVGIIYLFTYLAWNKKTGS